VSEGPVESVNPRGFKVAEGYVEVKADVDDRDVRRKADHVTDVIDREVDRTSRHRAGRFFKALITPDPQILSAFRTGIPAMLGTPIVAAGVTLGIAFAGGIIGGVLSVLATGGLAAAILAIGGIIVSQTSDKFKAIFKLMKDDLIQMFKEVTHPLVMPMMIAVGLFAKAMLGLEKPLKNIFETLAPLVIPITTAVSEFITILVEGLEDVMPDFAEILGVIAEQIPGVAEALVDFFSYFAENKEEVKEMVIILFQFTNWMIRVAAPIILQIGEMLIELRGDFRRFMFGVQVVTNTVRLAWRGLGNFIGSVGREMAETVGNILTSWQRLPGGVRRVISSIMSYWITLPMKMISAMTGVPASMFSIGAKIVSNLVSGIWSQVPSLRNVMGEIASTVLDFLPGSPVKKGPLTKLNQPSTNPGTHIAESLISAFRGKMDEWSMPDLVYGGTTAGHGGPSTFEAHVYLDGQEITKRVDVRINERNRQTRRAVRSGGNRLP
jgi:hypothetical protein